MPAPHYSDPSPLTPSEVSSSKAGGENLDEFDGLMFDSTTPRFRFLPLKVKQASRLQLNERDARSALEKERC